MKYFWQFFAVVVGVTLVIFLFFALSVKTKNSITFTGQKVVTQPEITSADPQLGPTTAKVTIVTYADFQCETCATFDAVLKTIQKNFGTDVRLVWKDMPNSSAHAEAIPAAVAARCAGKQGKFWEFHDTLMANQPQLGLNFYTTTASNLKLKANAFSQCLTNQDTLPLVQRGYDEGVALHVTATPTVYLNGVRYDGNLTLTELSRNIDDIIRAL